MVPARTCASICRRQRGGDLRADGFRRHADQRRDQLRRALGMMRQLAEDVAGQVGRPRQMIELQLDDPRDLVFELGLGRHHLDHAGEELSGRRAGRRLPRAGPCCGSSSAAAPGSRRLRRRCPASARRRCRGGGKPMWAASRIRCSVSASLIGGCRRGRFRTVFILTIRLNFPIMPAGRARWQATATRGLRQRAQPVTALVR